MTDRQIWDIVLWILRFMGVGGLIALVKIGWHIVKWIKKQDDYNAKSDEALREIKTISGENHIMLEQRTALINTNENEHSALRQSIEGLAKAVTALTEAVKIQDGRIIKLEKRRK